MAGQHVRKHFLAPSIATLPKLPPCYLCPGSRPSPPLTSTQMCPKNKPKNGRKKLFGNSFWPTICFCHLFFLPFPSFILLACIFHSVIHLLSNSRSSLFHISFRSPVGIILMVESLLGICCVVFCLSHVFFSFLFFLEMEIAFHGQQTCAIEIGIENA